MKKIIINHKSYLSIEDIKSYMEEFPNLIREDLDIVVFPNVLYLSLFEDFCTEVGSQNFYSENYGDYTGEINLKALRDLNVNYTMICHKDRLSNLLDSFSQAREKLYKSLNNDFKTILVVGEDKMSNDPFKSIKGDLNYLLKNVDKDKLNNLIILYEPMWLNDEMQDINIIRKVVIDIKEYFINHFKTDMEVLYGSGVDSNNINEILNVCDGVGIGKNSINIYTLKEIFDKIN